MIITQYIPLGSESLDHQRYHHFRSPNLTLRLAFCNNCKQSEKILVTAYFLLLIKYIFVFHWKCKQKKCWTPPPSVVVLIPSYIQWRFPVPFPSPLLDKKIKRHFHIASSLTSSWRMHWWVAGHVSVFCMAEGPLASLSEKIKKFKCSYIHQKYFKNVFSWILIPYFIILLRNTTQSKEQ